MGKEKKSKKDKKVSKSSSSRKSEAEVGRKKKKHRKEEKHKSHRKRASREGSGGDERSTKQKRAGRRTEKEGLSAADADHVTEVISSEDYFRLSEEFRVWLYFSKKMLVYCCLLA